MKRKITKPNDGFTIIEVLIVLAIAGLILAIVFLAVPALQRSSRNTSMKNDAASVLAGVNDFIANNGGAAPTGPGSQTGPTINIGTGAGVSPTEAKVRGNTVVTIASGGCGAAAPTLGTVEVHTGCKCATATSMTAANRAISVWYSVELTSAATPSAQCLDS